MTDAILYSKKFRGVFYDMECRGEIYSIISYNSLGIPEVLYASELLEEAKEFFSNLFRKPKDLL